MKMPAFMPSSKSAKIGARIAAGDTNEQLKALAKSLGADVSMVYQVRRRIEKFQSPDPTKVAAGKKGAKMKALKKKQRAGVTSALVECIIRKDDGTEHFRMFTRPEDFPAMYAAAALALASFNRRVEA